jgi:hypothetical protein
VTGSGANSAPRLSMEKKRTSVHTAG